MSWVTVAWSMITAACLSFAAVHLLVWLVARDARASLLFAIGAGAMGALTMLELVAFRAATPAAYGQALRWMHVAVAVVVVAIVWFVHAYLGAGRAWLAWIITGFRALVLVPNFVGYPNATFREISALASSSLLGDPVSVPIGEANPWRILVHLSMLLLLVYVADAAVVAWRRGERRRGLAIGGAIVAAALLSVLTSQLMVRGVLPGPLIGPVFLVILGVMGWELSIDLIHARELARHLGESQQRMELAMKAADLTLWEWDVQRDEVWVNEAAQARTGFDPRAAVSLERYLQLIHADDRPATREAVMQALRDRHDFQAEYRVPTPDGGTRWVAAQGIVLRDADGTPVRLRGIAVNVTARRHAEVEIQQQRASLAQLQRASAVGQLSVVLAHELNQPLGAILRNAEAAELIVQRAPLDLEQIRAIIADIRRDDQRAAEVLDRMRALLRHRSPRLEAMGVRDLVGQVATIVQAEIHACRATLELRVPEGLPAIVGDRVHLQQVLLNLLLNSLDASRVLPQERRALSVEARRREDGEIEVIVRDRGPGFPADALTSAFEPFVTTKSEGTGLGLAISKSIVEAHGGRIWAENDPQGGAVVRFTLEAAHDRGAA